MNDTVTQEAPIANKSPVNQAPAPLPLKEGEKRSMLDNIKVWVESNLLIAQYNQHLLRNGIVLALDPRLIPAEGILVMPAQQAQSQQPVNEAPVSDAVVNLDESATVEDLSVESSDPIMSKAPSVSTDAQS